jgi:adenine-specific DNA-methyltransferase
MADDGLIFVHIDQKMLFELKLLMDEVFGRTRFLNLITRRKCNRKNYTRNAFGNVSDHILLYSKTAEYVWHRPYESWSEEQILREYPYVDEHTGGRFKKVPVHAPGMRNGETGKRWRGKLPPPGKHWQYPPARLDEMDREGDIYWSPNGNPRRKIYFEQSKGLPVQDLWLHFRDAHNQNVQITGYPTEKNYEMLELIVRAATNPGDLVLDCFCGSGTTLEAAARLGRRFIGIDNSAVAKAATLKRLTLGRTAMGDFVGMRGKKKAVPAKLPPPTPAGAISFGLYEAQQSGKRKAS